MSQVTSSLAAPPLVYAPFITASGVDVFLACPASAVLPRTHRERGAAAQAGTEEHAIRLLPGKLPPKILAWFGGRDPIFEAALAVDCAAVDDGLPPLPQAKFLGQFIDRAYVVPGPRWWAGSADMLDITGDVVSVADLKTGQGQARGSLPAPDKSGQLLSLAWGAIVLRQLRARAEGGTWTPSRIRLAWWLTADAEDDIIDAEISYDALMLWVQTLCHKVRTATAKHMYRGPQCIGCGAFDSCPAQGGALRRVLAGVADLTAVPDDQIATIWQDIVAAHRILDDAEAALKLRVERDGEVVLSDTHRLKMIRGTDTRYDVAVAADVLGDRFADVATVSVTAAGLRRALGAEADTVIESIRQRGGVVSAPKAGHLRLVKR